MRLQSRFGEKKIIKIAEIQLFNPDVNVANMTKILYD